MYTNETTNSLGKPILFKENKYELHSYKTTKKNLSV